MSPNFAKQQQKQQQPIPFPQSHKKKNTLLHRTNRILNIIFSPHQQAITIKCLVTKTNMIVRIEGSRYFYLPKILLLARKQTGVVLRSRVSSIWKHLGKEQIHNSPQLPILLAGCVRNISPSLWEFEHLTALYLNDNQLLRLPADVGMLVSLRTLDLSSNKLRSLPAEIGELIQLRWV